MEQAMVAVPIASALTGDSSRRRLQAIGAFGAGLALAILGASLLLRLTTIFGADGQTISTLPPAIESATRMVHRLSASGVGLMAMYAAFLWWVRRPLPNPGTKPIAWFVAATVFLAVIGPLTPGYRMAAVTVGNVMGGMVLLMSCWWLRESLVADSMKPQPVVPADTPPDKRLLRAAICVFLLHAATGAAASATGMHGGRWFAFVHLGTAVLSVMFVGASLWDHRREPSQAAWTRAAAGLMLAQLALGLALIWLGTRPTWLAFLHAMLAPLLAIALVSLATRDATNREPARVL